MTVYAIGSTNDDLMRKLRAPDPTKRADAARALGELHDYLALPHLIAAARSDSDEWVRAAARRAVRELMPSKTAADRAIRGHGEDDSDPRRVAEARAIAARAAIEASCSYVSAKRAGIGESEAQGRVLAAVTCYLEAWGGDAADDLDEVGITAAEAIGAIARFLEIPPQQASPKYFSFRDAKDRVRVYADACVRTRPTEWDPESDPYLWRRP